MTPPLLDVLHENTLLDSMRTVMQEFYQPLKARDAMIKFCFITGITRLSQLNIFSTLNISPTFPFFHDSHLFAVLRK